jgi:hypothetical protein
MPVNVGTECLEKVRSMSSQQDPSLLKETTVEEVPIAALQLLLSLLSDSVIATQEESCDSNVSQESLVSRRLMCSADVQNSTGIRLFGNLRGLDVLLQLLVGQNKTATTTSTRMKQLAAEAFDIVTSHVSFPVYVGSRHGELRKIADTLSSLIHYDSGLDDTIQKSLLRVLLNLTSGFADVIVARSTADPFLNRIVRWASQQLLQQDNGAEEQQLEAKVLASCLLINCLLKGKNEAVTKILMQRPNSESQHHYNDSPLHRFLQSVANDMITNYKRADASHTVFSGYCALLLGSLSLTSSRLQNYTMEDHEEEEDVENGASSVGDVLQQQHHQHRREKGELEDVRVAVLAAVDRALRQQEETVAVLQQEGSSSRSIASDASNSVTVLLGEDTPTREESAAMIPHSLSMKQRPMLFVVALVQENFMLFQHAAGLLTKDMMRSIQSLVEQLMAANQITVDE